MSEYSKTTSIENPPDPSRIMDGLRDTGYDFNTAVADIIDNSVAAFATKIVIRVEADAKMNVTVSIADDGIGMDFDGLKNAMRYGSDRREDPSGLGKFGLGLKTASTAFCRKLSVVSRPGADDPTLKVCWDLDHIAETNSWSLLCSDPLSDEVETLDEAAEGGSGTLVLWENIDRLFQRDYARTSSANKALKRYIDGLRHHVALVYQRFLDPSDPRGRSIRIWLNDEEVQPYDPFCIAEEGTNMLQEQTLDVSSSDDEEDAAELTLRAYLLPRKEDFSSPESASEARISNDTQGFYVYREDRLIYSGSWMGMFKTEPHYSLLRVELSFDNSADEYLHVDIKKSRILLDSAIHEYIATQFLPPLRREAEQRYRQGVKKEVAKGGKGAHEAASKSIDSKARDAEQSRVIITDRATEEVQVENGFGTTKTHIDIHESKGPEDSRVIPVDNLEDGVLWCPAVTSEGKHAVKINMSHSYYQKVYYPLISRSVTVIGMDSLLWALSEAELSTYSDATRDNYEEMRVVVSRALRKLIQDLPDPEFPDEA